MPSNGHSTNHSALFFERQWLHAAALIVLLAGCFWASRFSAVRAGELWGAPSISWYSTAILIAVIHQVYVWICWRAELHGNRLTGIFGAKAFALYAAGFAILGISRVVAMFLLAYANRDNLAGDPLALKIVAAIVLLPALYLFYSVKRYFTFTRAVGADHFDPAYRSMPLVRKGIFRFTSNGMYVFGFFLLWVPALWWASPAALAAALFNHLYIWVHFFATENPDMRHIYGAENQ